MFLYGALSAGACMLAILVSFELRDRHRSKEVGQLLSWLTNEKELPDSESRLESGRAKVEPRKKFSGKEISVRALGKLNEVERQMIYERLAKIRKSRPKKTGS